MNVKTILERKGYDVYSMTPHGTLGDAVSRLAMHRVGALVICDEELVIKGILSERDVVRALAEHGAQALDRPLSEVMTKKVRTCNETNTVNELMELMTRGRFRHFPVEKDGRLHGIVSIGDIVKSRIEEIEQESNEIRAYIATA